MNYLVSGVAPQRLGNSHPNIVPYQDFPTSDGYMIIAVGNDAQFSRLCAELDLSELAQDPRFVRNQDRVANRQALVEQLCSATLKRPTADWVRRLEGAGVPCGPINTIDAVFDDPQVQAREMRISMPHPSAGAVDLVASPLRLSKTPASYRLAPPTLGAQTREVLGDLLGLSSAEIDDLAARGII